MIKNLAVGLFASLYFTAEEIDVDEVTKPIRERIEWCDIWITDADREDFPRVLLIGDSIARGYFGGVEESLKGKANCARLTTSRCICDEVFFDELILVLRQYQFRVIHFNNGLHGQGYTEEQYRKRFPRFLETLRQYTKGTQLIWASTTPVRNRSALDELSETTERMKKRNLIAREFVTKAGVPVNDLFGLMLDHPEYYSQDGVHFNAKGITVQSQQVSQYILKYLVSETRFL